LLPKFLILFLEDIPRNREVGMAVHACNPGPSTQEVEAGRSQAQGQPKLHCKTLLPRKQKPRNRAIESKTQI
jgi:hypothetical protein